KVPKAILGPWITLQLTQPLIGARVMRLPAWRGYKGQGKWGVVGVSCRGYLGGGLELKTGGEGGMVFGAKWLWYGVVTGFKRGEGKRCNNGPPSFSLFSFRFKAQIQL
ncbi:hypothetical protein Tco_1490287, partial [Tanacetum coccineum]